MDLNTLWAWIVGTLLSLGMAYLVASRTAEHRMTKAETRLDFLESKSKVVDEIKSSLDRMEGQWDLILPSLGKIIHSPDHKRRDELVDKYLKHETDFSEMMELSCMLRDNIEINHDNVKVLASALLLAKLETEIKAREKIGEYSKSA